MEEVVAVVVGEGLGEAALGVVGVGADPLQLGPLQRRRSAPGEVRCQEGDAPVIVLGLEQQPCTDDDPVRLVGIEIEGHVREEARQVHLPVVQRHQRQGTEGFGVQGLQLVCPAQGVGGAHGLPEGEQGEAGPVVGPCGVLVDQQGLVEGVQCPVGQGHLEKAVTDVGMQRLVGGIQLDGIDQQAERAVEFPLFLQPVGHQRQHDRVDDVIEIGLAGEADGGVQIAGVQSGVDRGDFSAQ